MIRIPETFNLILIQTQEIFSDSFVVKGFG